jgi:hypothetical protein
MAQGPGAGAGAGIVVSGDADLKHVLSVMGIEILSPARFVARFSDNSS